MPCSSCSHVSSRNSVRACCLDRVVHDLREVLVLPVASREADEREAGRQQAAVGEVVDRGHELLAGEVSGHAEDHERARTGDAVEAVVLGVAQRVVPARDLHGHAGPHHGDASSYWAASKSESTSACGIGEGERDDRAPVAVGEHAGVAGGLRLDQLAERERTAGDLEVDVGLLEDLQEHADGGSALVELAGRVQEPRAPAERRRAAGVGGDELAQTLQLRRGASRSTYAWIDT